MKNKTFLGLGLAAIALSIGVGVYGILGTSGNTSGEYAQNSDTDIAAPNCPASMARGKELDPLATGDIAAFRALDEPLDLTEIKFVDDQGNPKTLADWKGKTVLFNLWATWCPPCREEMPYFETLQTTKGGDTFQVVPVSIDLGDAAKPKAFYAQTGLKEIPFLHDNTMNAFHDLKKKAVALGMPTTLLVDTNGCGLGVLNGPAKWDGPDAIKLIDAAIALPKLG
ncbi:MAG: redoxin family protein [Rhizobiaceae bacterium]|nr:redoxin family protein [Rhizobiaceae bacterium]